jgi:transglutaminase-like putative cysteine protease
MKIAASHQRYLPLIRWPDRLWRSVAWLVIICFSVNCITPAVVAAKTVARDAKLFSAPVKTEFDLASDALIALEETLDRMDRRLNGKFEFAWQETLAQKSHATPPAAAARDQLQSLESGLTSLLATLDAQQGAIQAFFDQAQTQLKTGNIDPAMQVRAQQQTSRYAQMYTTLNSKLTAIIAATADADYKAAVADAAAFLRTHSSKQKRAKFDPSHLAFGPSKVRARPALTDALAIQQALQLPDAKGLASVAAKSKAVASTIARIPAVLPESKSHKKLSATASKTAQSAAGKDMPANLAANEDVQITAAIQAKAAELGNNPLKIYQFVRNNVEYMPTYGSIQGSDYTLQTMRGNDIDQASLLIALLRAANIPSHYVYGTIRLPIEQVENWVGGVTDPNAALDLMGQGGIPTLGLAQGGVIKFAQIEHVWVEAQVGFAPSRGAVTLSGTTWVPMDASFKQYTYTQGMTLQTAVPFDAAGFADHIQQTSTIDPGAGWVQNVDQSYVSAQLTGYETHIDNFVNGVNAGATVGDVVGTKTIAPELLPVLAGGLPYPVTATATKIDSLPDTMRWAFHYQVDGQTLLSQGLPSLAGRLMALSFAPASQQDEAVLESYIPKNATDPSELPTALPAGIAQLKAEFSVDGQTVITGATYGLGAEMTTTKGLYRPGAGWQDTDKTFTAGQYQSVGLDPAGLSPAQVKALQTAIDTTRASLGTKNYADLTKHDLTGALLQAVQMEYLSVVWAQSHLAGKFDGSVPYRLPSFGTVSTNSSVALFFGVPAKITETGVLMDMDRIAEISVDRDGNASKAVAHERTMGGFLSENEHAVPEQAFAIQGEPAVGVSASKAISLATGLGQRIYGLTSDNAAAGLAAINVPLSVKGAIADAIYAGDEVTVHSDAFDYGGMSSIVGYTLIDPATGAGSYMLSNGADGSCTNTGKNPAAVMFWCGALLGLAVGLTAAGGVFLLLMAIVVALIILPIVYNILECEPQAQWKDLASCFMAGFFAGLGAGLALAAVNMVISILISIIGPVFSTGNYGSCGVLRPVAA